MFKVNFVFDIEATAQFSAFECYFYLGVTWKQFPNTYSLILLYYNLCLLDMVIKIDAFSCCRFLFHWRYWIELTELVELV